jgi:hypothetical protein
MSKVTETALMVSTASKGDLFRLIMQYERTIEAYERERKTQQLKIELLELKIKVLEHAKS